MKTIIISIITAALLAASAAAGQGILYFADQRYIMQSAWVEEKRAEERRRIQYEIDELEYIQNNERPLTEREKWQLRRLRSQMNELR